MTLHHETPTWRWPGPGPEVWLKMEALQPTGSFKLRGIGRLCEEAVEAGAREIVSSSGGNAGLAAAWAGRCLGVPVTVFVPTSTPEAMRARIGLEGADVRVEGRVWDEAHAAALDHVRRSSRHAHMVHPFDHPAIWRGHATLIHELARQAPRPARLVVAVGGGGLLCGVVEGLAGIGWSDVEVVAVETAGAASYAAALAAGQPVRLEAIRSVASSLGALAVCEGALEAARRHPITSLVVSDREAVEAALAFADRFRVLVEPACGAALAALARLEPAERTVVIVCGGAVIDLATLRRLQEGLTQDQLPQVNSRLSAG